MGQANKKLRQSYDANFKIMGANAALTVRLPRNRELWRVI